MCDNKISAAVARLERAWIAGMDEEYRDDLRAVLDHLQGEAVPVAGLTHQEACEMVREWAEQFNPQPAELSEVSGNSGELPPLPKGRFVTDRHSGTSFQSYTTEQMQDYARAALAATGKQHPTRAFTDKEIDARLDALHRNMVASGQHNGGMVGVAWNRAVYRDAAYGKQQGSEVLTDTYVQTVPDKCDRIVWQGHYYHLPIKQAEEGRAVNLSPIATRKLGELAAQGYVTNGVAIFNPATGQRGLVDNLGFVGWLGAQGIDLGQVRDAIVEAWRASDSGSPCESKIDAVLALIDQRDAGAKCNCHPETCACDSQLGRSP